MGWKYEQSTGKMYKDGKLIETGYSGALTNKNNPDRQHVKGLGPLPRGTYKIAGHSNSKGPITIILEQTSGESFGRSEFRIHGDHKYGPAGFASEDASFSHRQRGVRFFAMAASLRLYDEILDRTAAICFTAPAIAGVTDWSLALKGIASGDAHWIEQAPALAAVADGNQAQRLEDALAAALTTNTNAALKALRTIDAGKWPHMVGSDIVCTPPLEKSSAEIDAFYQHTRQALLETVDGAHCLSILEATMEEFKAEKARRAK